MQTHRRRQRRSSFFALATVALACALAVAAVGCGGGSEEGEEEGEERPAASASVPASLGATEADAEDLVDVALADDRNGMREQAAKLRDDANKAADALVREDVPAAELARLRQRAARVGDVAGAGDGVHVALAANDVSALMPTLFSHFETAVPPDVLKLDYLDREAQLRSLAHESAKVAAAIDALRQTWNHVRAEVVDAGGEQEAQRFSDHVAAMNRLRASGDAEALQREAVNGLNLVDELERVFA